MANNDKENKIKKFTKEAIGKTLNQFNKEIGVADLVEVNKNQDRILNGILSQVNDENTEKTEKSNIITLDNSTDGIVELKEIQGDTNVNVSKIEEDMPITHDIGEKEGNAISLDDIAEGAINIDNIQGNTMVNCNKEADKELILMEDLSTEGYSNITLTEGVDGGKVDVALEGNTMVNVCDQKDPVAITKSYTVETGNHVALQGEYDGKCRPVVNGNTLVNLIDKNTKAWSVNTNADGQIINTYKRYTSEIGIKPNTTYTVILSEMANSCIGYALFQYVNNEGTSKVINKELINNKYFTINITDIDTALNSIVIYQKYNAQDGNTAPSQNSNFYILEGDYTNKPIPGYFEGLQSSFEDKVVTQEMVDNGEELAENLGKYKVDYVISKEDGTAGQTKTFYLNSPLLEGDTIEQQGDNVVHVHRYEQLVYDGSMDENWGISNSGSFTFDGYTRFLLPGIKNGNYYVSVYSNTNNISNTFRGSSTSLVNDRIFYMGGNSSLYIVISNSEASTVEQFKTYLSNNPFVGIFKLSTPQYEVISQNDTILCDSYVNGHLDVDSVVPIERVVFKRPAFSLKYLYPSTKYIIQFEADNNGIVDNAYMGGSWIDNVSISKGINKFNITTSSTIQWVNLDLGGMGFNASNIVVTQAIDQEFGYFEGMKSVGECEDLEVVSSNSDETQSNTQTLTHEPLRAVGDIKDKYVLIDGKWYIERNCGEAEIVNTMPISIWGGIPNTINNAFTIQTGIKNKNIKADTIGINCEKYTPYTRSFLPLKDIPGICDSQNQGTILMKLPATLLNSYSVDAFKAWLGNNSFTIIYILASPIYEPIDYNPLEVYSDVTHITTNSAIPTNITIKNHGFNCLLKPSTTYTVSSNLGINTVTTGADIGDSCLRFYNEDTSNVTTMRDVLILEGDWTSKADLVPNNFSGIESCFEQALVTDENDANYGKYRVTAKVVGKNLLDIQNISFKNTTDYTLENNKIIINSSKKYQGIYYYIPTKRGTNYTISCKNINSGLILIYDEKITGHDIEKYKGSLYPGGLKRSIVADANYITIRVSSETYVNMDCIFEDIMVYEEIESTAYEPYKENNITFYINEPLRGVGNVKDRVFIQDDKVVVERKCSSVTFDGSEAGWRHEIDDANSSASRFALYNINTGARPGILEALCPIYYSKAYAYSPNTFHIMQNGVRFHNNHKLKNVTQWKEYLSNNPTTVVYQLAEPTYEEVEYSESRLFLDTYNNSTLFYESNIPVSNTSFKPLWEELVYLKNSTKYYIQFNSTASGTVVFNLGGTEVTKDIVEGYNNVAIDTPAETTNLLTIDGHGIKISEVVISESVCGGHYLGLQSCFEEHMENGKYRVLLRGIALDGSKVNGIKLYLDEPLRGIGDIKDRLCIKNGKLMVERKCGSVILGCTGNIWDTTAWGASSDKTIEFRLGYNQFENKEGKILCDNFISGTSNLWLMDTEGIQSYTVDTVDIRINKTRLSTQDVAGFRQWLQQNPTTLVYQLAEPTYEEVTNEYGLPIVFEGYENGIVYIDSAVTPTTHIKYTSNNQLATTLAEAEEQNIATQEDINMNVVTYMMDIDMMLTDMEMSNDISVMAVRRDSSNENMLDRMSDEDKKVYRDNTVVMLEKMITANVLDKEDIEGRIDMYYNKNRISKEQYKYLKSLL